MKCQSKYVGFFAKILATHGLLSPAVVRRGFLRIAVLELGCFLLGSHASFFAKLCSGTMRSTAEIQPRLEQKGAAA